MLNETPLQRQKLALAAYADEKAMLIRKRTHDLYTVPPMDYQNWVLERIAWNGNEQVLDLGSGPGTYAEATQARLSAGRYVGVDLSMKMLQAARERTQPDLQQAVAHGQQLPFPANAFDVVLANHVLYHLPDIETALGEIRRVLRPEGLLVAATNSQNTMPEFHTLVQRALRLLGRNTNSEDHIEQQFFSQFSLESGTVKLARHFRAVARYDVPSLLVFTEAQPIIEYIESTQHFYEPYLPEGIIWKDFVAIMSDQVRRLMNHFGELSINKLSGVLLATDSGGFAAEFVRLTNAS
ncbi:MAG: class I SAM-dependent methyltransferase [Anaerolineae bacterium]|nr:class I SAM-dependent methyltransferase [Anaerolineae bacterium]